MADNEYDILIREDGTISYVYADAVAEVFASEETETRRASHVEPAFAYGIAGGGWVADMRPSNGPILLGPNSKGFTTRQAALNAERQWLREERDL